MNVYADTSFLVSVYLTDSNSPSAAAWMNRHNDALSITPFQRYELRNAIRLAAFRKQISSERRKIAFAAIDSDLQHGFLKYISLPWDDMLRAAERLSAKHTENLGARGLDLLHVAIARTLAACLFLTFDGRQAELARRAGFKSKIVTRITQRLMKNRMPNAVTRKTLKDTDAGRKLTRYNSLNEMFKDLGIQHSAKPLFLIGSNAIWN